MKIEGPSEASKGPHYVTIGSESTKSDYIERSIPSEPTLKRRIMVLMITPILDSP